MHTIINYFVRNLPVADLGIQRLSFPFAIVKEQDPYHWPLTVFLCRCVFPLSDLFFGVSVWSITLIAVDRHRAIVRGVLPKRGSTVFKSARWMHGRLCLDSVVSDDFGATIRGHGFLRLQARFQHN